MPIRHNPISRSLNAPVCTAVLQFFRDELPAGASVSFPDACPRVLYVRTGSLATRSGGVVATLAPNSAWHGEQTAFARVMILPADLRGKSSIRYVLAEGQGKEKRQTYQLFVDEPIGFN